MPIFHVILCILMCDCKLRWHGDISFNENLCFVLRAWQRKCERDRQCDGFNYETERGVCKYKSGIRMCVGTSPSK